MEQSYGGVMNVQACGAGDYQWIPTTTTVNCTWPYYNQLYITNDKGQKAYELVKGLIEAKLVEVRTVKQFTELMDFFIARL